jgi:hypothetical protein
MGGGKMRRKSFVRLIIAILIIACVVPFFEPTWAQEPTQMTLEGTHSGAIAPTVPCFACIPPSASGSIKLVVDFETGSVSGEVSGSGAGEATADICDEDDQPTGERHTASGEITYSGTIIGSIDPQSGAISAKTTLQWPMEATITGVVKRDGSASGKFYFATGACAFDGGWNAQATSIVYPPSPTPSPQPTETHTPEPTETHTPEPTETPTPEPTETPTPEPTETPTLEPTETSTPEPKGVLPISDDQDRDKTADLVRNLEQLLAGKGVKGPTPGQAAAAGVAIATLISGWILINLLSPTPPIPPMRTPPTTPPATTRPPSSPPPTPRPSMPLASTGSFLEKLYRGHPTTFRKCQDMPWAYLHKREPPHGSMDKKQLWDEMKRQNYGPAIWGDYLDDRDAPKLVDPEDGLQDGDIIMLGVHEEPLPSNADHYAVVRKGKIYMIWNAPGGGRYDCIDLEDFTRLFETRTETDSWGKIHRLSPYRYFEVYRKRK